MAIYALIPAAGSGSRLGGSIPKQYRLAAGKPLITYALEAFAASRSVRQVYVVVAPDDIHFERAVPGATAKGATVLRVGGETRQQSVLNGLIALHDVIGEEDWVMVHDAARPGLTPALIARLVDALEEDAVGGLLALPVADTLKREREGQRGHRVDETISREGLWQAQTPQMFRYGVLCSALTAAVDSGLMGTDEANAIEALGHSPKLVLGSTMNFKVTYSDDLELANNLLRTS